MPKSKSKNLSKRTLALLNSKNVRFKDAKGRYTSKARAKSVYSAKTGRLLAILITKARRQPLARKPTRTVRVSSTKAVQPSGPRYRKANDVLRSIRYPSSGAPSKGLYDSRYKAFIDSRIESPGTRYKTVSVFALVRVSKTSPDSAREFAGRRKQMMIVTRIRYERKLSLEQWARKLAPGNELHLEMQARAETFNAVLVSIVGFEGVY